MILADLGAKVVRVDRAGTPGDGIVAPEGPPDRRKHSITLNLKDPEDLEVCTDRCPHSMRACA
jgi:alpha-methylacyl-CoA racemase